MLIDWGRNSSPVIIFDYDGSLHAPIFDEKSNESIYKSYVEFLVSLMNYEIELKVVLRGGSWFNNPNICRSAFRDFNLWRVIRYDDDGFRVVCVAGRTLQ